MNLEIAMPKIIFEDLMVEWKGLIRLYHDNELAINIAHNLMQTLNLTNTL